MIKYRKAKEIIDQVADDLSSYDDQGLIDYGHLYRILRRCNETLGHKLNPSKEEIVHIKNHRGSLPNDFLSLNFSFVCTTKQVNVTPPKGFQIEYKTLCTRSGKCNPCLTECDNDYAIFQLLDDNWTQYKNLEVVGVSSKSSPRCAADCLNFGARSEKMIDIGEDGLVTTTFPAGELYLNYVGSMENDDEDLLVIDDALVEPYYEAELTKYILKSILYNKDGDVADLYKDAKIDAARAKIDALRYVATPGYTEIVNLWKSQRTRLYNKYFLPILGY